MPWPPATNSAFLLEGITTIKWGTAGILDGTGLGIPPYFDGCYVVKSMRAMDIFETLYIENGTGIRSVRVGLIQGREWEVTVVDDSSMTAPTWGTPVTISDTISETIQIASVIDNSYNAARKQEGERVMRLVIDTNIEGSGTIPPRG